MRLLFPRGFAALSLSVFVAALFGQPAQAQIQNPVAAFVAPSSIQAGAGAVTLTMTGSGFVPGSAMYWGAQALPTIVLSANTLTATAPAELTAVTGQYIITVVNPNGARSNNVMFVITEPPLSIVTAMLPAAQAGTPYAQTLAALGGAAPYRWEAVEALPAGLALSGAGQITGTPAARGEYTLTVRVTDAQQHFVSRSFLLSIAAAPLSISTGATLPPAVEGVPYTYSLSAVNGTAPVRWSSASALPAWLTLGAAGLLQGTPTARGAYTFTIQVSDGANATASQSFSLTVQAPPLVVATLSPLFVATTGDAYSQTFSATGGTQPYKWAIRGSVAGLALDPDSGVLSGIPSHAGSYTISVQVTDTGGSTASKDFVLTVKQPELRITNNSPLPSGTIGVAYQQRFLATGGQTPYSWTILTGSMPGLVLDAATGILAATPSASGAFTFTVLVRDSAGASTSKAFTVTIEAGPLRLSPLPEALRTTAGETFTLALTATAGVPPYTWSANGLPEGLEISPDTGFIQGTPRVPGSWLFTVRVTDAARAVATELGQLEVLAPAAPALILTGLPEAAKAADQNTIGLRLDGPYRFPITGRLSLSFAAETGLGDPAIQFSTGGRTATFRIPAGATDAELATESLGIQTGTVAGVVTVSASMEAAGALLTPTPVSIATIRIERAAPAITSAVFTRTESGIGITINGYSTAREITQAVFRFRAAPGSTLADTEITLSTEEMFGRWYRDPESTQYGGQFTFTQPFNIQGNAAAVTPVSVTLSNRSGSTTADIRQ